MPPPNETDGFLGTNKVSKPQRNSGCCRSNGTKICCIITGVIGAVFLVIGIVALILGEGYLEHKILQSMALTPGSDRFDSWLHPPVQPHLYGYAFHVTNPEAVLAGRKPILEEKGPYVYKAVTVKDSDDNIVWHDDDTITYRPRKIYTYEPSLSGAGLDPDKDMITVPNIPLWTGLNSISKKTGLARDIGRAMILENGLATPFVTVSFSGLLWGYEDELPCLKLDRPSECSSGDETPFSEESEDDVFGDDDSGDEWGDWKRKKREAPPVTPSDDDPSSPWYKLAKPKAEIVDCKCNWGLFRDRNVTMRKPTRFLSGVSDLSLKGVVTEYDGKTELGWWKKGSTCDKVKGQDSSTLPPALTKDNELEIFISLMCRTIKMEFEKENEHADIKTLRFIPTPNALGSHDDPDPEMRNPDNECYCVEEDGYKCFKSGVLNMEPCKRETNAPLALSMPHFYGADQSFRDAVGGLTPDKEKHQFYLDVVPEFGFPLAIRPRFQLNIVIGSGVDTWDKISNMQEEIVMPFLWAQDGFDEPSEEMANAISFGLKAPQKLPVLGAVVFFVLGGLLLFVCLGYFIWRRRGGASKSLPDVIHS